MEYPKADDTALICLKFENGAQGVVHASTLAYEPTLFPKSTRWSFMAPMERSIVTMTGTRPSRFQERVGEGPVSVLEIPERIWGQVRRDKVHDTYRDVFRKEGWMTGQFIDAIAEGKVLSRISRKARSFKESLMRPCSAIWNIAAFPRWKFCLNLPQPSASIQENELGAGFWIDFNPRSGRNPIRK